MRVNPFSSSKAACDYLGDLTGWPGDRVARDPIKAVKLARSRFHPDRTTDEQEKKSRHEIFVKIGHACDLISAGGARSAAPRPEPSRAKPSPPPPPPRTPPRGPAWKRGPSPDQTEEEILSRFRDFLRRERERAGARPSSGTYSGGGTYDSKKSTY